MSHDGHVHRWPRTDAAAVGVQSIQFHSRFGIDIQKLVGIDFCWNWN